MKQSKSEIRRVNCQTGGSQEELRRELEEWDAARRRPKGPKAIIDPSQASLAITQELHRIIDAGGEQATFAYAALSRFCALQVGAYTEEQAHTIVSEFGRLMAYAFGLGEAWDEMTREREAINDA